MKKYSANNSFKTGLSDEYAKENSLVVFSLQKGHGNVGESVREYLIISDTCIWDKDKFQVYFLSNDVEFSPFGSVHTEVMPARKQHAIHMHYH